MKLFNLFNPKQWRAIGCGIFLETELSICCFAIGTDSVSHWKNLSIAILGTGIGWAIGTGMSPWSPQEESDFAIYAKAISAFVSGYLMAKIDPFIHYLLDQNYFATHPLAPFRLILLSASILIAAMVVFCLRRYSVGNHHLLGRPVQTDAPPAGILAPVVQEPPVAEP